MLLSFVTNAYQHKEVSCSFPHCVQGALHIGQTVRESYLLFDSVGLVSDGFTLFVFSQIVGSEIPLLIMSGFEPSYHRMMVGLLDYVFICPFSVFCIKNIERFIILLERIMIVTQFESVIIVSSNLFDTKVFSVCECYDLRLISLFIKEVMFCSFKLVGF